MELELMVKALGEPTRFRIFNCLLERKHCVRSLARKLGVTESAISQHMKVLKEAELVYGERCGYHVHYLPAQEAVDALAAAFGAMAEKSKALNRDGSSCQCEYRKEDRHAAAR